MKITVVGAGYVGLVTGTVREQLSANIYNEGKGLLHRACDQSFCQKHET
jgi:hypothetical protein